MPPAAPAPAPAERFRDTINVPIAIPAWGALVMIAGAVFTSGTLYQQMGTLIDNSRQSDARISLIHDRQIVATAAVVALEKQAQNTEARMSNVERVIFERKR